MELKITSKYPKNVIEDLVSLAHDWAFASTDKRVNFRVRIKNSAHAYGGRYYAYDFRPLVIVRIGTPVHFPRKVKYPNRVTAPEYVVNDWQEAMFKVAFHEFWHGYQHLTNSPYSEVETEHRVVKMLEKFREMRPMLNAKWEAQKQKVIVRIETQKTRAMQKNTPQYELTLLGQKMATFQRRIKLYTTKMKKLQRRKRHLEKKVAESACLVPANS